MANPEIHDCNSIQISINSNMLSTTGIDLTNGVVATDTVRKVANLLFTCTLSETNDFAEFDLDLYNGSTLLANLATNMKIYKGNTICLVDRTSPIILTEGMKLRAREKSGSGSAGGSNINFYCVEEVYSNV